MELINEILDLALIESVGCRCRWNQLVFIRKLRSCQPEFPDGHQLNLVADDTNRTGEE
jgi:hypothetical protein